MDNLLKITADYLAKTANTFRKPLIGRLLSLMAPDKVKDVFDYLDDFERLSDAAAKGRDIILHNPSVLLVFHASKRIVFSDGNATLALHNLSANKSLCVWHEPLQKGIESATIRLRLRDHSPCIQILI